MDLRPLALALALAAPITNAGSGCADDPSYGAGCGGGYPSAPDYGTRQDVYVRDNGQIEVFRHQATSPGDNLRIYDYEVGTRVDQGGSTEIQGYDPDALNNWSK